jgi:diaminohydroxyphosphoribosylaminopyrimidine deaminase/5-amino-6-(5-phosphoribosylamino)uracil reductase
VSIRRALELVEQAGPRGYPKPTVGAVVVRDGEIVGEGVTEPNGRHGEVVALAQAGERARGATLYVTLEPCAHQGTTPPCTAAILAAGVERVVFAAHDPNPEAAGGEGRLRASGVDVEFVDWFEARVQNEAWRTWVSKRRPFVIYKLAATLDGRVTVPGQRWVTGDASRRRVHELRANVDAVAVGAGTLHADQPRLDARDVETPRGQPRRLVFTRHETETNGLEARRGPLAEELATLAGEGVQSLLLEGGPTLGTAFLAADLVDKVLVFVAPTLAGSGGLEALAALPSPRTLSHLSSTAVGDDVLLEAYVHDP